MHLFFEIKCTFRANDAALDAIKGQFSGLPIPNRRQFPFSGPNWKVKGERVHPTAAMKKVIHPKKNKTGFLISDGFFRSFFSFWPSLVSMRAEIGGRG